MIERRTELADLADVEHFKPYLNDFNKSEALRLKKQRAFKTLSAAEQEAKLKVAFYNYIRPIEAEKLRYFALTRKQHTLIITAPSDNKEQKEFLGYDWSTRKGKEGIKILHPGGKLYNEANREASDTLAAAIRESFTRIPILSEANQVYASVLNTVDMLDFSRSTFNSAIKTVADKYISFSSKYRTIFLGELPEVAIQKGQSITAEKAGTGLIKVVAGGKTYAYLTSEPNRTENIVTVSASGANAGYINYWDEPIFASDCTTIQAKNTTTTRWLFYFLKSIENQIIDVCQRGAAQPHVYPADIEKIPVPDIDLKTQKKIVAACSAVDAEYESTRMSIETYREKIQKLFADLDVLAARGATPQAG